MRIVIYARVSTYTQEFNPELPEDKQPMSLDAQKELCIQYVRAFVPDYIPEIVDGYLRVYHEGNGIFRALLDVLESGDHIVVYALDRVTRNIQDAQTIWTTMQNKNITLHAVNINYVSSNPGALLTFEQGILAGYNESRAIGSRVRMVNEFKKSLGGTTTRKPAPLGYKKVVERVERNGRTFHVTMMKPTTPQAELLFRFIYLLSNSGSSTKEISDIYKVLAPNKPPLELVDKTGKPVEYLATGMSANIGRILADSGILQSLNIDPEERYNVTSSVYKRPRDPLRPRKAYPISEINDKNRIKHRNNMELVENMLYRGRRSRSPVTRISPVVRRTPVARSPVSRRSRDDDDYQPPQTRRRVLDEDFSME